MFGVNQYGIIPYGALEVTNFTIIYITVSDSAVATDSIAISNSFAISDAGSFDDEITEAWLVVLLLDSAIAKDVLGWRIWRLFMRDSKIWIKEEDEQKIWEKEDDFV